MVYISVLDFCSLLCLNQPIVIKDIDTREVLWTGIAYDINDFSQNEDSVISIEKTDDSGKIEIYIDKAEEIF